MNKDTWAEDGKIMSGRGACGKIGYLTRNDAKRAGRSMTKRSWKQRAYRCTNPACASLPWHLTKIQQRY